MTRFTSQSSYFYGEHHWPNSTNVEKTDLQPPLFYQLAICHLESRNKFLLDRIWKYRCTARTGKDLYYLVFIDHFILQCVSLALDFCNLHEDHADAWSKEANCFVFYTSEILRSIVNPTRLNKRQHT